MELLSWCAFERLRLILILGCGLSSRDQPRFSDHDYYYYYYYYWYYYYHREYDYCTTTTSAKSISTSTSTSTSCPKPCKVKPERVNTSIFLPFGPMDQGISRGADPDQHSHEKAGIAVAEFRSGCAKVSDVNHCCCSLSKKGA